jgi:glycosyltransferase involved in cell wall biosynthesis
MADLAVPGSRVRTVPNGVDVPSTPAALPHHRIPRVGALGRLTPQKGFDVLLRAVGALIDRGAQLEVVIGGSGRDEAVLRRAAAGLPVTFGGFIRDVRGFLGGVDLFCLPSGRESMPLALLEAMDEGRPCIATDVGAIAEAVGTDAVVLPPDDAPALTDALARLLADRHCRVALGAQAHRRAVRQFDARVMTARTYAALARVQAEAATAPVGR